MSAELEFHFERLESLGAAPGRFRELAKAWSLMEDLEMEFDELDIIEG